MQKRDEGKKDVKDEETYHVHNNHTMDIFKEQQTDLFDNIFNETDIAKKNDIDIDQNIDILSDLSVNNDTNNNKQQKVDTLCDLWFDK